MDFIRMQKMWPSFKLQWHIRFICLITILILIAHTSISYSQDIVVNKDNPVEAITLHDLKDIYFGKKNFWTSEGSQVKISPVYNHGKIQDDFLKMLNSSKSDFRRHWYKLVYSGQADPPKGMQEDNGVIRYVTQNKGAIGFVTSGSANETVKVIKVIP